MPRYFKATDGKITVFRASEERVYLSATTVGRHGGHRISYSAAPAKHGSYPTVEITKAEYDALVGLKKARVEGSRSSGTSPQESWVSNASLPTREG